MEAFSRRALGTSAVYGVLSIIFCLPLFSQPAGLSTADWGLPFTYHSHVLRSLVEYRQLPFWNPGSCGGTVLWQQPLVPLLSPAYLLSAIMPLALAMKITIVLHYWLAFVGMHLLLTRVIGLSLLPLIIYIASVCTLAGTLALHLSVGHNHFLPAFYLPLQLYFVCRALRTGALRPALGAAAILALTIYNGGLHLLPIELLSVGGLATCLAVATRDWRPLMIALVVAACGAAYAAPRLVPIVRFMASDRIRDTSDPIDHPDRMTPAMLWRAYTDSSLNADSRRFDVQRHGWWEYGNYIGLLAALCICLSLVWPFVFASMPQRSFAIALALMAVWFLILSAGEFHAFAPALALTHVPLFSDFRVPSRYTIPFVLFGTLAIGAAARPAVDRLLTTRRRQGVLAVVCVIAVAQLVIVNQRAFRTTRSQPAGLGLSADNCREPLQLIRSADDEHPLVWSDGKSHIVSIEGTPNRVQFAVVGGFESSKVFLNQNYAPGWRSGVGPVLLDPGGRMYVQLAAGQTGTFSFSFVPPGLTAGVLLLVVALIPSALVWNRRLSSAAIGSAAARREIETIRFTDRIEQATKIVVLVSIVAAVMTRAFMAGENHTAFALIAVGSFAVAWALSARWERAAGVVLALTLVAPAVFARFYVQDANAYPLFLTGGLLGAMWPRWARRHWSLPIEWRVPLVGWALTAAVAWPITAAREIDFHPEISGMLDLPASALGISARGAISIAADAAILLMLGILWLDWLFERYADDRSRFRHMLVTPFLIGGSVACAIAAYQLFGDITFLNTGWADFRRAGATMMDANAFGIVAVLCSCGFLATMDGRRGAWDALMLGGFALSLIGTWASGSKTALVAELIVIGVAVESVARHPHPTGPSPGRRRRLSILAITAATAGVLLFALRNTGPALRLGWILPDASVESVAGFMKTLWDRAGYGRAAIEMIRSSPWFGVGIGSFPVIVGDYPFSHNEGPLAPDNAQNWIRHNLAEMGTIGSLGWMVWAAIVVTAVVRHSRGPRDHRDTIVAGGLIGVVAISQFGMPTQNALVAIAFWMFLFWYFSPRRLEPAAADRRSVASWQWILMTVWIVVFGIGTVRTSLTTLRPPVRARHAGWYYVYGFYAREVTPSGEEYRRTAQHAVAVVPAATRVAKLTVWETRPDVDAHPVIARVWHDQRLVIDTVLRDNRPVSTEVFIDRDPKWLMVRTYLDRTLRQSTPDGLALQWTFLNTPPTESGAAIR
jgi:hypothetical protein